MATTRAKTTRQNPAAACPTRTADAIYADILAVREEANNLPMPADPAAPGVEAHAYWTRHADACRAQKELWSQVANVPDVPAYARTAICLATGELQTWVERYERIAANYAPPAGG